MAEIRRDIITDAWVIVQTEPAPARPALAPEPEKCPFCTGHEALTPPEVFSIRPDESRPDQPGWLVRVVPSNAPILRVEGALEHHGVGIHDMVTGIGANEVVIETPEHIAALPDLAAGQIALVLQAYRQRITDLYRDPRLRYCMVFKNYRQGAGASNLTHSHSELIALPATPRLIKDELTGAREYFEYKERCLFCDILQNELADGTRVLLESPHFVVFAPYASRFPYELTVMPRRHVHAYEQASDIELDDLGRVLKQTLTALRAAIDDPPYNYVLDTAPNLLPIRGYWQTIRDDYHWHLEIIPRTKRVVGFEWGSGFHINPVAPELAVRALKGKL
jgi:UDPglucose--hexose-1-phosphate uridylyltransferase